MVKILLEAVTKKFDEVTALDRVSLEIADGEMFFLLGPSGCGKTTLLRLIAGFCRPDAGAVFFDGARVDDLPPYRRQAAMVFQNYALWPHMTVAGNIAFGLTVPGRNPPRDERNRRVQAIMEAMQLGALAGRRPPGFPAASSKGSPWPAPWWSSRIVCCSMSRYQPGRQTPPGNAR